MRAGKAAMRRLPKYTPVISPPVLSSVLPLQALPLLCHPVTPCASPLQVTARIALAGAVGGETSGGLLLIYCISGDVSALKIPPPARPIQADGLWQHTCFEAFIAVAGEQAYRELNFSPSGQWASYCFSNERLRDATAEAAQVQVEPKITTVVGADSLRLQVWLPHSALPVLRHGKPLHWGLNAVLEDRSGQLSYWALCHPAARPDFHHRSSMALTLSPTDFDALPVTPHLL